MLGDWISVIEIARIHGKRTQSIHKIVNRLGIETKKIRTKESRGQLSTHISNEDYERVCEQLLRHIGPNTSTYDTNASGVFYLIQLEPEHDPGRFKLGFTSNLEERLRSHKTAAPFAKIIDTWPCKLLWEKTAIESITVDCERLYTEVFRTTNLEQIRKKADEFFSLMPKLK